MSFEYLFYLSLLIIYLEWFKNDNNISCLQATVKNLYENNNS